MSDENDTTDTSDGEGIKNLRKQYEAQQRELADAKKLLGDFQAQHRKTTVAELLKAKGIPESAADLYSGEEVSEDAVGKWVEKHADIFQPNSSGGQLSENEQNARQVAGASQGSGYSTERPPGGRIYGDANEIGHALKTLPMDELIKQGYMPTEGRLFNPRRPKGA